MWPVAALLTLMGAAWWRVEQESCTCSLCPYVAFVADHNTCVVDSVPGDGLWDAVRVSAAMTLRVVVNFCPCAWRHAEDARHYSQINPGTRGYILNEQTGYVTRLRMGLRTEPCSVNFCSARYHSLPHSGARHVTRGRRVPSNLVTRDV